MNKYVSALLGWFGWGGALGDRAGKQTGAPTGSLVAGTASLHTDGALQISAVWACVDLLSRTIASLEVYAKAVQNGLKTRNECRQLENDPPIAGGDVLTAQVNLVPIDMLGKVKQAGTVAPDPVQQ